LDIELASKELGASMFIMRMFEEDRENCVGNIALVWFMKSNLGEVFPKFFYNLSVY